MVSSSTPISDAASDHTTINNGSCDDNDCLQYSPLLLSLVNGDSVCGASALSAALRNSDPLGELRVGSLTMHMRHPSASRGSSIHRQHTQSNSCGNFEGSVSLPQPRAPFLSSREGPKKILSSMPEVTLPESAVSAYPQSSTSQYGSLRESRFVRSPHDSAWRQQRKGKLLHADSYQPRSLPAQSQNCGIGEYVHLNSGMRFNKTLDSGIATRELLHKSNTDLITDGCKGITLNEDLNCMQGHANTCSIGGDLLGCDKNRHSSSEDPPCGSLTAFDVLTHIRESQTPHIDATENIQPSDEDKSVGSSISVTSGADTFEPFEFEFDE